MTCDDYLAMLETLPVEELTHGSAREHAAICRDCNRVTRVVAERERNMLVAYGDVMPMAVPANIATTAIATARRRRVAFFYRVGLAAAAVATAIFIFATVIVPKPRRAELGVRPEPIRLRCMSGAAAADLLRADADVGRAPGVEIRVPPSGRMIVISGDLQTRVRARAILDRYDGECLVRQAR